MSVLIQLLWWIYVDHCIAISLAGDMRHNCKACLVMTVSMVCHMCFWRVSMLSILSFFLQLDASGQPLHPYIESQMGCRSLPNSSSEMCLRSQEEHLETRSNMRKHSSMTRLSRDGMDGENMVFYGSPRRIVDSCVQTDDEDGEER